MASVYRVRDHAGKPYPAWRFKYRNAAGGWTRGIGWPDRRQTKDHALALEAEAGAVRRGEKEAPAPLRNAPIAEAVQAYLELGAMNGGRRGFGWSPRHAEDRARKLRYWIDRLHLSAPSGITLAGVEDGLRELAAGKRSRKTVNAYAESIKALTHWLTSRRYLRTDPLTELHLHPVRPDCPHRLLTDDEVRRLLAVAPPARALLYRVALLTGYRAGELRALRVRDLDRFAPALRLSGQYTKSRTDAVQPITPALAAELAARVKGRQPEASLLDVPGAETVSENYGRDCARAGIRRETDAGRATFHSFRVNYINGLVAAGLDLKSIMQLARHGSAQMSMETYAKPDPARLREAAEAVSGRLNTALAWHAGVARAVGAEGLTPATTDAAAVCAGERLATPTGFEPVFWA